MNNESKIWGSSIAQSQGTQSIQSQGSQSIQNSAENDSNIWGSSVPETSQKPVARSNHRPTHADLSDEVDFDRQGYKSNCMLAYVELIIFVAYKATGHHQMTIRVLA